MWYFGKLSHTWNFLGNLKFWHVTTIFVIICHHNWSRSSEVKQFHIMSTLLMILYVVRITYISVQVSKTTCLIVTSWYADLKCRCWNCTPKKGKCPNLLKTYSEAFSMNLVSSKMIWPYENMYFSQGWTERLEKKFGLSCYTFTHIKVPMKKGFK